MLFKIMVHFTRSPVAVTFESTADDASESEEGRHVHFLIHYLICEAYFCLSHVGRFSSTVVVFIVLTESGKKIHTVLFKTRK